MVDYDRLASTYDSRYQRNRYDGVSTYLHRFIDAAPQSGSKPMVIAEAGCGTGHWLAELSGAGRVLLGFDLSAAMLARARDAAPHARLARASADRVPWPTASVDCLLVINALHHFPDQQAFVRESRRVLRTGGRVLTIGLDPHAAGNEWWVYDYFPGALRADRERYPPAPTIREWLASAGFGDPLTEVAQHLPFEMPFDAALREGYVDRRSTSQLMVIGDEEFDAGMKRLAADRPILRASLRLFATSGTVR